MLLPIALHDFPVAFIWDNLKVARHDMRMTSHGYIKKLTAEIRNPS